MSSKGRVTQLTRDHSANDEEERARIVQAGGLAVKKDSWRIGKAGIQVTNLLALFSFIYTAGMLTLSQEEPSL
jgi:serine/threonine protein phosphatase PrpC